jgi:hypothetical protein
MRFNIMFDEERTACFAAFSGRLTLCHPIMLHFSTVWPAVRNRFPIPTLEFVIVKVRKIRVDYNPFCYFGLSGTLILIYLAKM